MFKFDFDVDDDDAGEQNTRDVPESIPLTPIVVSEEYREIHLDDLVSTVYYFTHSVTLTSTA